MKSGAERCALSPGPDFPDQASCPGLAAQAGQARAKGAHREYRVLGIDAETEGGFEILGALLGLLFSKGEAGPIANRSEEDLASF